MHMAMRIEYTQMRVRRAHAYPPPDLPGYFYMILPRLTPNLGGDLQRRTGA